MKWSVDLVVHIFACCTFLTLSVSSEKSDSQRERLHEFVKTILGFKGNPSLPPVNPAQEAPKYMLDLYERFKDGPISKGQLTGNTVRSIKAKIGMLYVIIILNRFYSLSLSLSPSRKHTYVILTPLNPTFI